MSSRCEVIALVLGRHARRAGRSHCLCGWRSASEAIERHQAREVVEALGRDALKRTRGMVPGDCEHGAPFGGRGCIECRGIEVLP